MWIVSIIGLVTLLTAFIVALFPPAELPAGNNALYETVLIGGIAIIYSIPFIIYQFKQPGWKVKTKAK